MGFFSSLLNYQKGGRGRFFPILENPDSTFGESLLQQRNGGLTHLPPWVRTHRRVHRWVQAKLTLNAIKRRFKEKYFNEINDMIKKLRYGAMDQEGYISSETLWDVKDPYLVVVASNWRSMKEWNIWKNSDLRKMEGDNLEKYLDGETQSEIYEMGLYPH